MFHNRSNTLLFTSTRYGVLCRNNGSSACHSKDLPIRVIVHIHACRPARKLRNATNWHKFRHHIQQYTRDPVSPHLLVRVLVTTTVTEERCDVVNFPNFVPESWRRMFLSSSAQTWICASSVKMFVLVKDATLSGESTSTLQPRGETRIR